MSDEDIRPRLEFLRSDYARVTGEPFKHFFCPILFVDEESPLCMGHIIPQAFESSSKVWVPQREDVDNFYGSAAEAETAAAVENRDASPATVVCSPQLGPLFRPKIMSGQSPIEYFTSKSPPKFAGHTPVQIVEGEGENMVGNIVLKVSPEEVSSLINDNSLRFVIERDFRPQITAALIKAAHLTLFRMLGYEHVLSATGQFLAEILRTFYLENKHLQKRELTPFVEKYFSPLTGMIIPLLQGGGTTIESNEALAVFGSSGRCYSLGVFVEVLERRFIVFVPSGTAEEFGTYLSFLNDPPPSISAGMVQYNSGNGKEASHWKRNELARIPLSPRAT